MPLIIINVFTEQNNGHFQHLLTAYQFLVCLGRPVTLTFFVPRHIVPEMITINDTIVILFKKKKIQIKKYSGQNYKDNDKP